MIKDKMKVNVIAFLMIIIAAANSHGDTLGQIEILFRKHQNGTAKQKVAAYLSKEDSAKAYEAIGSMFGRLKNWGEAVRYLEIAKTREPKNPRFLYKLGIAYHQNKKTEEAVAAFRESLKVNPKSLATVLALGEVLEFSGDKYDARNVYAEAVKKDRKAPGLNAKLCRLNYEESFWKESIKSCELAVQQNKKDKTSWALLAVSLFESQERERAMETFKQGLVYNPRSAIICRARGLIFFRENSFEQAVQDLGIAASADADDDEAALYLARSLYELGRYNDARIAYYQGCLLDRAYRFEFQSKQKDLMKKNLDEMASKYQDTLGKVF